MEENLFNKIQHAITFLSNHYGNVPRDYGHFETNYYQAYLNERFEIRPDVLDVINQLREVPFASIFTDEHRETFLAGSSFLDGNCTVSNETHIGVHWEVSNMLFYYLVNELTTNIRTLVQLVRSDEFSANFLGLVDVEDDSVSYSMIDHEGIDVYIRARVPKYGQLVFVFDRLTNYVRMENSSIVFETKNMLELIDVGITTFDFSDVNIV